MSLVLTPGRSSDPSELAAAFKKEVSKSILAIILFIVVYLLLVIVAAALVALCLYAGYALISLAFKWFTILGALGLIGLGVMVFVFLIKFLFDKSREDVSDSIEITANDQPKLVAFIHDVAKEVGTRKPKKIYITHDVNACVFYNSSFWSMFLPVRKNLKIGLGLVNALNISEFKAVIAHEFGHFSQRSMKLGSFVYNVNHIIYNMLYRNTGYAESLKTFADIHVIFFVCAKITTAIVRGIQWVLQQMYKIVNLSYLGLSRQMEFHADLVAARSSGSNNIVSSLKRIDFAASCYQSTLSLYDRLWKENKRATDLYHDHSCVMKHLAKTSHYRLEGGLPVINEWTEDGEGRINVNNQWASHPTTLERKEFLDKFDLEGPVDSTTAWSLFQNEEILKQQLTQQVYIHQEEFVNKIPIDNAAFEEYYTSEMTKNELPEVFEGYYNDRMVDMFDTASFNDSPLIELSFGELFTNNVKILPKQIDAVSADIELLKKIQEGTTGIKTFDLHGRKYKVADAAAVIAELEEELKEKQERLKTSDRQIAQYFYQFAAGVSQKEQQQFVEAYNMYFKERESANSFIPVFADILQKIHPVYEENLSIESAAQAIEALKSAEQIFKKELQQWLDKGIFDKDQDSKDKVLQFIQADYQYFSGTEYFNNELEDLRFLAHNTWHFIISHLHGYFKLIAEKKNDLLKQKVCLNQDL